MGNKSSTSQGQHGKPPHQTVGSDIRREGRPQDGVARPLRPTSAPVEPQALVNQTPNPNFSLRARDRGSSLISGRFHGNQLHASQPNVATSDLGDSYYSGIDLSYLPRGVPQAVRPEELDVYRRTVAQVTTIWPEYNLVREIDFESLSPGIRNTLQQIMKRLSEQHESILGQHQHRQELLELREESDALRQKLRRRENEIHGLKEELQILRLELLKSGHSGQYRSVLQKQILLSEEGDSGRTTPPHEVGHRHDYPDGAFGVDETTAGESEALNKLRRRERDGIFKATPLLQAEGSREELRRVVTRTHSLKPVAGEPHHRPGSTIQEETGDIESQAQVKRLEAALERERRQNELLKERMTSPTVPGSSQPPLSPLPPAQAAKTVTLAEYRDRYHLLEAVCLGKLKKTLVHQLSHANRKRHQQFACAVIQKSYDVALKTTAKFKETVKALVTNPANVQDVTAGSKDRSALAGHIRILESFKPGQGINKNISKLARKTVEGEDVSEVLTAYMHNYLQNISDVTNITDLVQNVIDELRHDYGDCTTPTLLNQSTFSDFLHDCCRLCWQMCVPEKPLYVCSRDHWRYEERYHVTDNNSGTTNARIDYYLWPILFSRITEGEVLYKGRVSIKV